jgi:putative tryptophan/tyrosine transport system substrate-binding protein
MMRRRTFVAGMAAVLAAPRVAGAQQTGKVYRVGFLSEISTNPYEAALRRSLRDRGWVPDENIRFEYRWAEGRTERLDGLAAELVAQKIDLMVVSGAAEQAREIEFIINLRHGSRSEPDHPAVAAATGGSGD